MADFLQRERIVAPPGWSRWLVPPAALSVHLAIGQAYAWSVFKPPLEKALDISGTRARCRSSSASSCSGCPRRSFGTRVERNGPRWAMFVVVVVLLSAAS